MTQTSPTLVIPVVNLNGTEHRSLLDHAALAKRSVDDAIAKLHATCPHGRDYPTGGYQVALDQYITRLSRLQSVSDELQELAMAIFEQR